MKKIIIFLLIILSLLWGGAVLKNNYLTLKYSSEFSEYEQMGYDFLHPWNGDPGLRVLSYTQNEATVYFYGNDGGEKVLFIKEDGQWRYQKIIAIWSSQGSADDYIIWPYFKNYVL